MTTGAEKLYSVMVLKWKDVKDKPIILTQAMDITPFPYLQRSGAKQFITFFSRTIAGATRANTRQQVVEEDYRVYAHARDDGLCSVVCCNAEYPDRVAFSLCSQYLSEFAEKNAGKYNDSSALTDGCLQDPDSEKMLKKFQNPAEADKVLKIQRELEEIQTLMLQNLDKVIERGDNISQLVCWRFWLTHLNFRCFYFKKMDCGRGKGKGKCPSFHTPLHRHRLTKAPTSRTPARRSTRRPRKRTRGAASSCEGTTLPVVDPQCETLLSLCTKAKKNAIGFVSTTPHLFPDVVPQLLGEGRPLSVLRSLTRCLT